MTCSTSRIGPVAKHLGDATVRMLAYNGSVPGPVLRVQQHSTLVVNVFNEGDLEDTVHWHGLRLDNRFDGTHETQAPIPIGGRFTYRIEFPDPGVYWYHPHIREDYGQEMGLVREHRRRSGRPGLLVARPPRARARARRRPDRGRAHRARSARPRRTTSPWAASATSCSSMENPTSRWAQSKEKSCACT